jgi:hypothetical protein
MTTAQTWKIPVTPAQRFVLLQLAHGEGQKLKGQSSRVFRRFLRAFGLTAILETMDDHPVPPGRPQVGPISSSRQPALFFLTDENVEYALRLDVEQERIPAVDRTIGPLFDMLEDVKAGRYAPDEDVFALPDYDAAAENWAPATEADAVDVAAKQIAAHLRAAGETRAAVLVEQGGWDRPANGAQGQRRSPESPAPQ